MDLDVVDRKDFLGHWDLLTATAICFQMKTCGIRTKDKLSSWMEAEGINVPELARRVGLHRSYVFLIVKGTRPATGGFKWRFAREFGWENADRVFFSGDRPAHEKGEH